MFTHVNTYHTTLINKGNTIDREILAPIELTETMFQIGNEIFEFLGVQESFIENFKKLISFYRHNLHLYLVFYENQCFSEKSKFLNSLENLKKCENLLKSLMRKLYEVEGEQGKIFKINIIKGIYSEIINTFTLLSNVILFHSNYIDNYYDEVIIRYENFICIIKALWIKSNEKISKSFKIFLQILYYQILTKLFSIDFKPLLREFSKTLNPKYTAFISFFYRIVEVYMNITSDNPTDTGLIEKSIELINTMFYDFMYPSLKSNLSLKISSEDEEISKRKFNEEFKILLRDLYNDNFLDKITFEKTFKSHLYHLFVINITKCYNLDELSSDTQKLLFDVPFIQICHRYLNLLNLTLIDTRQKLTNFDFIQKFYSNIDFNESFYDIESKINNISNLSTKNIFNLEVKKKLYYRYINSDISSLMDIQKYWKIDTISVSKIVLNILKSFTSSKRKYMDISDSLKKKDLYKLLEFINTGQEIEDHFILSFITSCVTILSNLISTTSDENSKKRNLSKFTLELGTSKAIFDSQILTETSMKLGLVPTICIVLSFLKFINFFHNKDSRRHCVKVIVDHLNFEKSTPSLKGFMISIFLKLIQHFDSQNSRDDVKSYIDNYLNPYVKGVISLIKEMENKSLKENDQSTLTELYETIHFYLKSLMIISEDKENKLLVNNQNIIDELREVISTKNVFPSNYKKMVVTILNNLFENIYRSSEDLFQNIVLNDEMEINLDFHEMSQDEIVFLEKNELIAKTFLVNVINSYITDKRNSQFYKGKVSYDLANYCCETSAKMLGILYKNKLGNYKCSFIEVYGTDKTLFSPKIRSILVDNNKFDILGEITSLAFKAYSIFLKYNSECFLQFIINQECMSIHHFLIMAFFALFHSNSNEKDVYLTIFIEYLLPCKDYLQSKVNRILYRDLNEKTKEELSYYNILLLIINTKETFELCKTNFSFLKDFIDIILDSIVLMRRSSDDIRKIEAKHFFKIIKNLEEIIVRNLYIKDLFYHNTVESIIFQISVRFSKQFISHQLDNESSTFIEKGLKIVCDNKKPHIITRFTEEDRYFIYFVEEIISNEKIDHFKEIVFRIIDNITNNLENHIKNFRNDVSKVCDFPEKINFFFNYDVERTSVFLMKLFNYITDEFIHYNDKLNCELYLFFSYNLLYFFSVRFSEKDYLNFNIPIIRSLKFHKISSLLDLSMINLITKTIQINTNDHFRELIPNISIMMVYKLFFIVEIISGICRSLKLKDETLKIRKKLNLFLEEDNRLYSVIQNEEIVNRFTPAVLNEEIDNLLVIRRKLRPFVNNYLNEILRTTDYLFNYIIINKFDEKLEINLMNIKEYIEQENQGYRSNNKYFEAFD